MVPHCIRRFLVSVGVILENLIEGWPRIASSQMICKNLPPATSMMSTCCAPLGQADLGMGVRLIAAAQNGAGAGAGVLSA
jgi:hypothetical protein